MENPLSWNEVQKAISEAIVEHLEEINAPEVVCGLSLESKIYYRLCEKGFLKEEYCGQSADDSSLFGV
jgi:hypothetical protein